MLLSHGQLNGCDVNRRKSSMALPSQRNSTDFLSRDNFNGWIYSRRASHKLCKTSVAEEANFLLLGQLNGCIT
jgi:hypothetical protein